MQAHRAQQKNTLILFCQKWILFFIPQGKPNQSRAKTLNTVKQTYTYSYLLLKYGPEMWEKTFHIIFSFSQLHLITKTNK